METLKLINIIIAIIFAVCYSYQFVYIPIEWILGAKEKKNKVKVEPTGNDYAVLICARNEENVIGDLINSLHSQTYDQSKLTVFVLADNCTDDTAGLCRSMGAVVYERQNKELVGKGYALDTLIKHIQEDYPEGFDAYFVFDADIILSKTYIERMDAKFAEGYEILTSYRNSKNYGDNWISAGYALWFLRESRYLNHSRDLLDFSCAVSGTGFMFSRKIAEEINGWPYHTMTEDIEFSIDQISKGKKIGIAYDAELFDEQPVKFGQSWRQRLRWSKGFLQVFKGYGAQLAKGVFKGSFACLDMSMNIMPAFVISTLSILINLVLGVAILIQGVNVVDELILVGIALGCVYLLLWIVGMITVITEWKKIRTTNFKKIFYVFTFPFFMVTYIPIAVQAIFTKPQWKPIEHHVSASSLQERSEDEQIGQ
ncbi:MAG: glycosyltransferase [Clostridia bacterium]|nr:glycosyltransferase [Clostridia bacterium]